LWKTKKTNAQDWLSSSLRGATEQIRPKTGWKGWKSRHLSPGIVVTDFKMPRMDGMELLQRLSDQPQQIAVVLLTRPGSIDVAVDAMKAGAYDFYSEAGGSSSG